MQPWDIIKFCKWTMFFKNIAMAKNSTNWLPVLKELLCELNGAG